MMKLSSELKFKVNNNDTRTTPKEAIPLPLLLTLKMYSPTASSELKANQSSSNVQVT